LTVGRLPQRSPAQLADALVGYVADQLGLLAARHLPGFRIPRVFAGHPVGPDVRADLAFTLGMLAEYGVETVAGLPIEEALLDVLRPVDGPGTHTFYSYRVAETLLRFGSFDQNRLLDRLEPSAVENLAAACDSTSFIDLLRQRQLPRNYAAVLARCEVARARLGLIEPDSDVLGDLLERTARLLRGNPHGYLDDSHTRSARYDIYTADIYLFTEPFADGLGETWNRGARSALDLVEAVATTNGAAFPWGRSSGALASCLTIELGGLAAVAELQADRPRWLTLAENAFAQFPAWMSDGVIAAHQYRSTFGYRGPHRRLQMTLDCLGKLVDSALMFRRGAAAVEPALLAGAFPDQDRLVWLDEAVRAGVWAYRSRDLSFVLPVVGCTVNDYLPAPRNPGLFEVPVERELPTGVPYAVSAGARYTPAHVPSILEKTERGLALGYDGFVKAGQFEVTEETPRLAGSRRATYRVEGRTLHVAEQLDFDEPPDAVAIQVAETANRPLAVTFECSSPHGTTVIDTAGLKEYRSFWAELPRVHQLDVEPAAKVQFSWSITPLLRVRSTAYGHHYDQAIYEPLSGRVDEGRVVMGRIDDPVAVRRMLETWDQLHLHWPEWFLGADIARHQRFIDAVLDSGVRVIWTQHNLVPHDKDRRLDAVYHAWAAVADGVIHHSHWGRDRVTERYRFKEGAVHRVIPHPHFGHLAEHAVGATRQEVEAELGLRPGPLRLGVVGAPRVEKRVDVVMEAVAASRRDDVELVVFSLAPGQQPLDDERITALPYDYVSRSEYERRLKTIDVLVLPFDDGEMLTTGTVGDAVANGLPCLASDWPFLAEVLGDAAIVYGSTAADLTAAIDGLDPARLASAREASAARQAEYDRARVAEQTFGLLEAVGTTRL
jgi:glycosyltransferase involved in cell wall biosynthesis